MDRKSGDESPHSKGAAWASGWGMAALRPVWRCLMEENGATREVVASAPESRHDGSWILSQSQIEEEKQ